MRCLVCQNQSIDDSDAPLARDLRTLVREQITAGKSDAEIMDFIVARYGEFVLLKPRLTAGTLLLWGTPFAVLLIAGTALLLRRRRPAAAPEAPLSEAERQALQRAWNNPDFDARLTENSPRRNVHVRRDPYLSVIRSGFLWRVSMSTGSPRTAPKMLGVFAAGLMVATALTATVTVLPTTPVHAQQQLQSAAPIDRRVALPTSSRR